MPLWGHSGMGWFRVRIHNSKQMRVHFIAFMSAICTCSCMLGVGAQRSDCCKSRILVGSSISQFLPMVCMLCSIACDIRFVIDACIVRRACSLFSLACQSSFCWKVQTLVMNPSILLLLL